MILVVGALLGFFSVAFGAYSDHGLRPKVSDEEFRMLMTAIRYNQVHALMISALGLFTLLKKDFSKIHLFKQSGFLFIVGTILFSFSIYTSVVLEILQLNISPNIQQIFFTIQTPLMYLMHFMFQIPNLLYLTPIGGITLMISWLSLAYAAYRTCKKSDLIHS